MMVACCRSTHQKYNQGHHHSMQGPPRLNEHVPCQRTMMEMENSDEALAFFYFMKIGTRPLFSNLAVAFEDL